MNNMEKEKLRMKELIDRLNEASRVYYQGQDELMSNYEYDALYDELEQLEKKTGITMSGSPTTRVGYEVVSELPKERHKEASLSLDKTKEIAELISWLKDKEGIMSWKMDGLTVVLTYEDGTLKKAVTRGNGEVGEVITANARTFKNLPLTIPYTKELVIRGEAVIRYSDFEKINAQITDEKERYKNPRNLCSGSVRQLNSEITAARNVNFFAFSLVSIGEETMFTTRKQQFDFLAEQGFTVVEHKLVYGDDLEDAVSWFSKEVGQNDFPSDGLVLSYNDIAYGKSLGRTSKFPKDSLAFKWADEIAETTLREIEWSASRTGLINPVAIFNPVELEGTTVSRASVHNISIMEQLALGIGDRIQVYKANMIIPQIAENLTRSGKLQIPDKCPVCEGITKIKQELSVKSLYCTNPSCPAKQIKSYALFVSRDAMNMDGLSEATIEKLIEIGALSQLTDFFHLDRYKEKIIALEGFGEKSYQNMINAIEKARNTNLPAFIYSLGIEGVGLANAKVLVNYAKERLTVSPEEMPTHCLLWLEKASLDDYLDIQGIGQVLAETLVEYFSQEKHQEEIHDLLQEIHFAPIETASADTMVLQDLTFVITGSLNHYENRNALKKQIEELGGKVAGSVSSKTSYLINNDATSGSSKNKKAKELGIEILTEEDFLEKFSLPH